jgi:hypothetical protein
MAKIKSIPGENWGVCGKMNTGKTHLTMEMALLIQQRSDKPILIFDHANNASYFDIKNILQIEDLEHNVLEEKKIYKISGSQEYELFLECIMLFVRNTIVILDDCGNYMTGNLSDVIMSFVTSPKNNGNDVFYQFHNFNDIAPKLCRNLHIILLKEQSTDEIPHKMPNADNLTILHEHIILENKLRDSEEIWAFRIYDVYRDKVFFEKPDGVMMSLPFRDYLDYYNQNLLRNITRQIERVQAIKKWII